MTIQKLVRMAVDDVTFRWMVLVGYYHRPGHSEWTRPDLDHVVVVVTTTKITNGPSIPSTTTGMNERHCVTKKKEVTNLDVSQFFSKSNCSTCRSCNDDAHGIKDIL